MRDTPLDRLTETYLDSVKEAGAVPDPNEVTWARNKIAALLHRDISEEAIAEGIRKMVGRNRFGGALLGTFVNEILAEQKDAPDKALLDGFLEAHAGRWPTGVTFRRGSHSGTYVYDPLGYDRADYGQWKPPRRQEVLNALRARKG